MQLSDPGAIEAQSFAIIEGLADFGHLTAREKKVAVRIVHSTGDPAYAGLVAFHPAAVAAGIAAIRNGRRVYADVNMVRAGINTRLLARWGGEVLCSIADPAVVSAASQRGTTRAATAFSLWGQELHGHIVVIGNAPTALYQLCHMAASSDLRPALVIGTPVGFVGAREAKELLVRQRFPWITVRGEKGGSTVAAAAFNALLRMAEHHFDRSGPAAPGDAPLKRRP